MTATEEVRRMLDERGVEWGTNETLTDCWTRWMVGKSPCTATEINGRFAFTVGNCTPEQAIEATLGRGTCRDVRSTDHTIAFECSECGCWVAYDEHWETGIYVLHETGQEHIHPRYCPNCGRRIEQ